MNKEAQRIAMAEACGWRKDYRPHPFTPSIGTAALVEFWWHPAKTTAGFASESLTDYLNDLNAMHEAEKTFRADQFREYCLELTTVICGWGAPNPKWLNSILPSSKMAIHASAAQRADGLPANDWKVGGW